MQRSYEAPNFQVRDTREFSSTPVAPADTRVAPPIQVGDGAWRDRLIDSLAGNATKLLNKMADISESELYLEGQEMAGVIESEAEIEGNPLTRDWKVAGYRDTMGKLALADAEAQFAVDIADLRQKGPEEFQQYLAKRRTELRPQLASMSRAARTSTVGQLLLQDRAATKTYTAERIKYIIEQKSQAVRTQWNTALRTLGAAQTQALLGDIKPEDMQDHVRSAAGTMVGSVWADASLPGAVRQQLTFEMLRNALENDSVQLYDYVSQNEMPDAEGGSSTLTSRLNGDQQRQLAGAYREAMSRTKDARNLYNMELVANLESQIDANSYTGSYSELIDFLNPMVIRKGITGERRQGIINKYLDKRATREQGDALAEMYMRGDINGILGSGKTQKDGASALDDMLQRRGVSPAQRLQTYLAAGSAGMDGGFQKAGEVLGVALRQVRSPDGTVLPQHLETVRTINDAVRSAERAGNTSVRVSLLGGLSEGDRMFAERVFARVDDGASYDEAVRVATDTEAKEAQQSPAVRAATSQQTAAEVAGRIREFDSTNILQSLWTAVKMPFSADAVADWKLRPESDIGSKSGVFSSGPTVQWYTQRVREELADEASRVLLANPSADADSTLSVAKANVAARTIQSRFGPITLPRNIDMMTAFGVSGGNQAAVGPALDALLSETKADSSWQVAFINGRMFAQEFDKNGVRIGTGNFIDPSAIKDKIREQSNRRMEKADWVFGKGREVSKGGVKFQYSGSNTAGVPLSWMYDFRSSLIDNEGVVDKPMRDLSGAMNKRGEPIMTVGVGVSSHNPRYPKVQPDGTVLPKDIQSSFAAASNDAAVAGARMQRELGLYSKSSFALLAELSYQSGAGFLKQQNNTGERYREFVQALKSGDEAAAHAAFKRTAAWYYSADPKNRDAVTGRQRHYLKLVSQSLRGE